MINICIIGTGYVGGVTAAGFAELGHNVTAIDINQAKIGLIEQGKSPVVEPGLDEVIKQAKEAGLLQGICTNDNVPWNTFDYIFICVATPSSRNGAQNLKSLDRVLTSLSHLHVKCPIIIRSTVLPGAIKKFQVMYKNNFEIFVNPEFIRETNALKDFFHPAFIIVGGDNKQICRKIIALYKKINCQVFILETTEACLVKYSCNAFHALKITFANEIASLCKAMKANPFTTLDVVCADKILNISTKYLRPGFAFGGSCLPKDLRVLTNACGKEVKTPLLSSILVSNEEAIARTVNEVHNLEIKYVGLIGVSFKKGSNDLRESPYLELARRLIGHGYKVTIYDPDVNLDNLVGSNRSSLQKINQLNNHMTQDLHSLLKSCEGVIICKSLLKKEHIDIIHERILPVLDLENIVLPVRQKPNSKRYDKKLFGNNSEEKSLELHTFCT